MEDQIIHEAIEELHTADTYFKNVVLRNNNLIIPYLNIGISEHSLNETRKIKFLIYSYLVAEDIQYLDI